MGHSIPDTRGRVWWHTVGCCRGGGKAWWSETFCIMPWRYSRYLKVLVFPNAGNHQKDLLGAARPMSLKPRTCSHCPIWASIMLNMDEYGLREDKAQKALRTLYITGLEESQQESKQRVFVVIGNCNCSWFCVLPVTCLPHFHTSYLTWCATFCSSEAEDFTRRFA